MFKLLGPLSF